MYNRDHEVLNIFSAPERRENIMVDALVLIIELVAGISTQRGCKEFVMDTCRLFCSNR